MDKSRRRKLLDSMKRNTESSFYLWLNEYLQIRQYEIQELLVKTNDVNEIFRLQGRATEMSEFLKALSRRPVSDQHDGAFDG